MKAITKRILTFSLLSLFILGLQPTIFAQEIVDNNLRFQIHRGTNNCAFISNPAHAWIFYVNGEQRKSIPYGGPQTMTVDVPLKDKDYGTRVTLTVTIYEKKCIGSKPRDLGTRSYGTINIPRKPVSAPAPITLAHGVYNLKVKDQSRTITIASNSQISTSTQSYPSDLGRIVFEPTGTDGHFYIRVESQDSKFFTVQNSAIKLTSNVDSRLSKFSVDAWPDNTYSIRYGNKYLMEDRSNSRIKLAEAGLSDRTKFVLKRVPRNVSFLATGDPQFENGNMAQDDDDFIITKAVLDKFNEYKYGTLEDDYRGVIISGDLTQNSRKDELDKYKKLTKDYNNYVFDGLGNHDMSVDRFCWDWNNVKAGYAACRSKLREYVRRGRAHPIAAREGIHYSWNWDDVHFVQLNLFPGETSNRLPNESNDNLDPQNALSFLKRDLAKQVGSSGRPVILIHHYGLESFSKAWWTQQERNAYWEAIADYNIAAIITGHLHHREGRAWWDTQFLKPCNSTKGPAYIPTFVAGGAADGGYYIKVNLNGDDLEAKRYEATFVRNKDEKLEFNSFNYIGIAQENITRYENASVSLPEGVIVRASNTHAVYLIEEQKRRHIPNPETLFALGYDWDALKCFPSNVINKRPAGEAIPSRKNGSLLRASRKVYVMQDGSRHWVTGVDAFNRRNYDWNAIQNISVADLDKIPEGAPFN